MKRYIALLRAINVTNRFVKMDVLRALFQEAGCTGVETYIQTGNVIFHSDLADKDALATQLEAHLRDVLGFPVPTMIRTETEFLKVATSQPFPPASATETTTYYVSFLKSVPAAERQAQVIAAASDIESYVIDGRQLYWRWYRDRGELKLTNARVERLLGMPATRRNLTTVRKIARKYWPDRYPPEE